MDVVYDTREQALSAYLFYLGKIMRVNPGKYSDREFIMTFGKRLCEISRMPKSQIEEATGQMSEYLTSFDKTDKIKY